MLLTDDQLNQLRTVGDSALDPLVAEYAREAGPPGIGRLMGELFGRDRLPTKHPLVERYDALVPVAAIEEEATVERGQQLFALYGPEALLILGSYALPLAFAAGNGVQAIARARRLKDDPLRRLCDTAQMVLNVMQVGQLKGDGVGLRAARKVRLIHALVRWHVGSSGPPWDPAWGLPINQEDLLGTLLTFSAVVLHGLRAMGAIIDPADADAYIMAWREIAPLLGIDKALVPSSEEAAVALANQIGNRQIRPTREGQELNQELLDAVETLFPFRGWATGLSHFFLRETVFGGRVVEALQLPPANWTWWLIRARAAEKRLVLALLKRVPGATTRRRFLARRFVQAMILLKRPDQNVPFTVPDRLMARWGLRRRQRPEGREPGGPQAESGPA